MGARKHNSAEAMKAARKEQYFAKANNIPTARAKCVSLQTWFAAWK